jgi:hypothetical protein
MTRSDFDLSAGKDCAVLPEDGHGFCGTIMTTRKVNQGYLVTVLAEDDGRMYNVNPSIVKLV